MFWNIPQYAVTAYMTCSCVCLFNELWEHLIKYPHLMSTVPNKCLPYLK